MEFDVDVRLLSQQFVDDYPSSLYPEFMHKHARPYACLLIDTHEDYIISIPFRSSIHHNHAFLFSGTQRSKSTRSGLDYTKLVLIQKLEYIDNSAALVDNDEYKETRTNIVKIVNQLSKYIDDYVNHMKGTQLLHPREFSRRYRYPTLKYFHDILGIESSAEP